MATLMMTLIDVTKSHAYQVQRVLAETPVHFIKVYTLGNSRVVYKKKEAFSEVVISNKLRDITEKELAFVIKKLFDNNFDSLDITNQGSVIDITQAN